ncbi:MAG: hypothetical protein RR550_01300 [Rikenellaceae bacterium]
MNKKLHYKKNSTKIYIFIVLCCLMSLSTVSYGSEKALTIEQLIQQKKITVNLKNSSIETILKEIKRQSGISFIFKNDVDTKLLSNMSLNVTNQSVESALNTLTTKRGEQKDICCRKGSRHREKTNRRSICFGERYPYGSNL